MPYCSKCRTKLTERAKFCSKCGNRLRKPIESEKKSQDLKSAPAQQPPVQIIKVYEQPKGGGNGKILSLLLLLLIIGGVAYHFVVPRLWVIGVMEPPYIELYNVNYEGSGVEGAELTLVLRAYNPNPVPIIIDRADFRVYIDGDYVGRGAFQKTTIRGRDTEHIRVSTVVSLGGGLKGAWNTIVGKLRGTGPTLSISGTAYVDVPILGRKEFPFSPSTRM